MRVNVSYFKMENLAYFGNTKLCATRRTGNVVTDRHGRKVGWQAGWSSNSLLKIDVYCWRDVAKRFTSSKSCLCLY